MPRSGRPLVFGRDLSESERCGADMDGEGTLPGLLHDLGCLLLCLEEGLYALRVLGCLERREPDEEEGGLVDTMVVVEATLNSDQVEGRE